MSRAVRHAALACVCGLVALFLAPATASAHGLVGVQDLPIPRWLFGWASALVLIASFAALAVLWPKPRLEQAGERRLLPVPTFLDPICGAIGVALFGIVVYAGLVGTQVEAANLISTFVFVLFWVGLVVGSLLFGDVFAAFNPWRAIGRFGGWVIGRAAGDSLPEAMPYPPRFGYWPAAITIVAFAWVELVWTRGHEPQVLAILALLYAAGQLIGMSLYGVEAWVRRGDGFGVLFGLYARVAPLRWERGAVYLRAPLVGLTKLPSEPSLVPVAIAAIGTTTFDGFSQGPTWTSVASTLTDAGHGLGLSQATALQTSFTGGLIVVVLIVAGLYRLGVTGMHTVSKRYTTDELGRRFAHSLIPIAAAYALAHYFSSLAYQGQAIGYLASNPLGHSLDPGDGGIFGTAQWTIDYAVVGPNAIWYVQVGALVIGHICGLILAHDRALTMYRSSKDATRSQYWMLAVMVAFTSLGLWLLSAGNA